MYADLGPVIATEYERSSVYVCLPIAVERNTCINQRWPTYSIAMPEQEHSLHAVCNALMLSRTISRVPFFCVGVVYNCWSRDHYTGYVCNSGSGLVLAMQLCTAALQ